MPPSTPNKDQPLHSDKIAGVAIAICTALVLTLLFVGKTHLAPFEEGKPAPYSLRVSPLHPPSGVESGVILVQRGEEVSHFAAAAAPAPASWSYALSIFLGLSLLFLLFNQIGRAWYRGRWRRHFLVLSGVLVGVTAVLAVVFLTTSISILAAPVALVGIVLRKRSGPYLALFASALTALLVSLLVPSGPAMTALLLVQATLPVFLLPRNPNLPRILAAGMVGGLLTSIGFYLSFRTLHGSAPTLQPIDHSTFFAAMVGGAIAGPLAMLLQPLFVWLCGGVSARTLTRLERLSQPLLKQLSSQAPGSWQHSLAVARLGEAAGASIDADVLLIRVGAYYHDIGKTVQPKFFIENISGGQHSIHETIKPNDSKKGIFEHVSKGMQIAKEAGLPPQVVDFIRSHHGSGLLEYFWKKQQQNPENTQTIADFLYPGTIPQCPETGIICICDALEAAIRNASDSSEEQIAAIVAHIVIGKLKTGQLDVCGLTLIDLRKIQNALTTTLVAAHAPVKPKGHRVDIQATAQQRPVHSPSHSSKLNAIRLDSQDKPRSDWSVERLSQENASNSSRIETKLAYEETLNIHDSQGPEFSGDSQPTEDTPIKAEEEAKESTTPKKAQPGNSAQSQGEKSQPLSTVSEIVEEMISDASIEYEIIAESAEESLGKAGESHRKKRRLDSTKDAPQTAVTKKNKLSEMEAVHTIDVSSPRKTTIPSVQEPILLTPKPLPSRSSNKRPASENNSMEEWESLDATSVIEIGPSFPDTDLTKEVSPAPPRSTIPLGNEHPDHKSASSKKGKRADSQDGLQPGEMVIGPPPSTHPKRSPTLAMRFEDVTVRRPIPVPTDARRPGDLVDEEQLLFTPPVRTSPFLKPSKKPPTGPPNRPPKPPKGTKKKTD